MNAASALLSHPCSSRASCFLLAFTVALAAAFTAGCGSSVSGPPRSGLSGNTSVTVLASSAANDQLSQFDMVFNSLTLTSQSGKTVSLFAAPLHVEFIHVNGTTEPLETVTVPQDVYTSATASIGVSRFACVNLNPSGALEVSDFANQTTAPTSVTVSLPAPITITGANMGLSLDLLVSKSASFVTCDPNGIEPFSITPTFNLVPLAISSQPTNDENGKETGLEGSIVSVDAAGNSFNVTAADGPSCVPAGNVICVPAAAEGPSWQVASNADTVFQGTAGVSDLAAGMPVDLDVTIQSDGSLVATRVAVQDTNAANLTVSIGPLMFVDEFLQGGEQDIVADAYGREGSGSLLAANGGTYSFVNAVFQVSGQFTNLQHLPFAANFTVTTMVAGQNVLITTHALNSSPTPTDIPAATITLMPQTINGAVTAVSSDGGFTTYTVALASYDLFPDLAVQPGQPTLLTNPGSVVIYIDGNTQLLNTSPIAPGSVLRFNGLIFNDGGTLRMGCTQVNDGVAE
ncbi:MAG: hypothetical protein WAM91_01545 [Candidatus Acidiferrales bacterium]